MTIQPQIHRYLPGGMECCLEESHLAPLVALQIWIKTGSLDEEESEAGLAHVLEHMVFKGSRQFPRPSQVVAAVEGQGGEIDASTSFDHTLYQIVLPSREIDLGLDILFDMVFRPLLPADELSRELEVVLEEVRRMRDNPGTLASLEVFRTMMAGSRMERPIIGAPETIRAFTHEKVASFHSRWYLPNNALFVAAGDFDCASLWEKLSTRAAALQTCSLPHRVRPHFVAQKPACDVNIQRGPWQGTRLHFACHAPTLEESSTPAWHMFTSLLGIGEASRLVRKVHQELGLVPDVDAGIFLPRFPTGLFTVSFFSETENAPSALAACVDEIARVAAEGPSHPEMQRVLSALMASRTYDKESVEGIARSVGYSLLTSRRLQFDDWYEERLGAVTAEEVRHVAAEVLRHIQEASTAIAAAVSENDTLDSEALRRALRGSRLAGTVAETPAPKAITSTHASDVQQYRVPLPDGRELHINARHVPRLPIVSAVLAVPAGSSLGLGPSTMHLTAQMLVRGTERQSFNDFVDELEDNSSSIAAFSTPDITGLHIDALSRHGMRCLEMALDSFLRPALSEEQWERMRRDTLTGIIAQKDSPGVRLRRMILSMIFGDSHPYGRPALSDEGEIEALSLETIHRQHGLLAATAPLILGIAGDFSIDSVLEVLSGRFSAQELPSAPPRPSEAPLPHERSFRFDSLEREQAHIALAYRAFSITDPRRTALELGSTILGGQGGRLFLDLRDARSLAYALGTSHSPALLGGYFAASMGTAPHKVAEALAGLRDHVERMANEIPGDEELERAKKSLLGSRNIDAQTMHYQASQLSASDLFGLGFDNFLRFEERILAVTPERVRQAFADMVAQSPFQVAVVGPEESRAQLESFRLSL